MRTRIAFVIGAALLLPASGARAQGEARKQAVISKPVLKAMVANKPKSKAPLGARAGIVPRTNVVTTKPAKAGPTSVYQIKAPVTRN
jgi:hypothetical protein